MTNGPQNLNDIAQIILSPNSSPGDLFTACKNLKQLLSNLTSHSEALTAAPRGIKTTSGLALGTEWAIKCIEDIYRTKFYSLGLKDAIQDKIAQNPGKIVNVLYAGCGPFATLMLPLTAEICSKQVQFTLLEINSESIQILKKNTQRTSSRGLYSGYRKLRCAQL